MYVQSGRCCSLSERLRSFFWIRIAVWLTNFTGPEPGLFGLSLACEKPSLESDLSAVFAVPSMVDGSALSAAQTDIKEFRLGQFSLSK
jgi:hypothetical protein